MKIGIKKTAILRIHLKSTEDEISPIITRTKYRVFFSAKYARMQSDRMNHTIILKSSPKLRYRFLKDLESYNIHKASKISIVLLRKLKHKILFRTGKKLTKKIKYNNLSFYNLSTVVEPFFKQSCNKLVFRDGLKN